jgi:hypothetical protein
MLIKAVNESVFEEEDLFEDCLRVKLHSSPFVEEKKIQFCVTRKPLLSRINDFVCYFANSIPKLLPWCHVENAVTRQFELKLTINFGQQRIKLPFTEVVFGLKGGELRFMLKHGVMPLEHTHLTNLFLTEVPIDILQERATAYSVLPSIAVGGKFGDLLPSIAVGGKFGEDKKTIEKRKYIEYPCQRRGSDTAPYWEFHSAQLQSDLPLLSGLLSEVPLARLKVSESMLCRLEATFKIRGQRDLCLIESNGLLKVKDLTRNKSAHLTREFFLLLIEPKLHNYMSKVEGCL